VRGGASLELLSPARTPEKLRFAAAYGADAVYAGAPGFSLRGGAETFSLEDLDSSIQRLHAQGKRLYLAANMVFHDEDLGPFREFLAQAAPLGFDGLILSDLGMVDEVRNRYPDVAVHISTQANTTNASTAKFYQRLGVKRIVLARELNLGEIRKIRDAVDLELEAFVHGAMCISYSGRCLLSNYFSNPVGGGSGNRDANRGGCTQVCRWEFALTEKKRPGVYLPVEQDAYGTAILSSKDLNLSAYLGDLIDAGVTSFKVEGRMRSILYASLTARVYRHALDRAREGLAPDPAILAGLEVFHHREYTTGFYYQDERFTNTDGALSADPKKASYTEHRFLGVVEGVGVGELTARAINPIRNDGRRLAFVSPGGAGGEVSKFVLLVEGEARTMVRPGETFVLRADPVRLEGVENLSLLIEAKESVQG
jgi:putative protease